MGHSSFFLQHYIGFLPAGPFSYDYSITFHSSTGFVSEFDDFGNSGLFADGAAINGHKSGNYPEFFPSPFFEYFGINIDDGNGTAQATVILSNFSGPGSIPEPASLLLFATGLLGLICKRRQSA
jgi:hypothetical protein